MGERKEERMEEVEEEVMLEGKEKGTGLRIERSGFEPLLGTLCWVLRRDTLLSQCLSPPRCTVQMGTGEFNVKG